MYGEELDEPSIIQIPDGDTPQLLTPSPKNSFHILNQHQSFQLPKDKSPNVP